MNEWGLPDWRDPSSYGDVQVWSDDRWRWEFYRRRDDLRAFFDRWAAASFKENHRANEGRHPEDPGFLAFGKDEDAGKGIEDFDYGGVPNPRISEQPAISIMPYSALVYRLRFYNPATRTPSSRGVIKRPAEEYRVWLKPNQIAIKFNLDEPLGPQIEDAEMVLRAAQEKLHGKKVIKRKHQAKWLGYLRSLDAKAARATYDEIAALHPNTRQSSQAVHEILEAANKLKFDFDWHSPMKVVR